jgi:thiol:disulfide interchange protein DsbD
MAAWVYGTFVQRSSNRRGLGALAAAVLLLGGYFLVLEMRLQWRAPLQASAMATAAPESGGLPWRPWSPEALMQARTEGKPVLVDFTAKWCLTCNTLVKPVLESPTVRRKIEETATIPFIGDYTKFDDRITEELNRYSRAGVPLVLVFPKDPKASAIVLPEAITPGIVVEALERAIK